jgi:hypothetical protein
MATIIQRCIANDNSGGGGEGALLISDEEKAQLLGEINKIQENINKEEK